MIRGIMQKNGQIERSKKNAKLDKRTKTSNI